MIVKDLFCEAVKKANISEPGWNWAIVDALRDVFARGYLTAKLEWLATQLDDSTEFYRKELLTIAEFDIWGKS